MQATSAKVLLKSDSVRYLACSSNVDCKDTLHSIEAQAQRSFGVGLVPVSARLCRTCSKKDWHAGHLSSPHLQLPRHLQVVSICPPTEL